MNLWILSEKLDVGSDLLRSIAEEDTVVLRGDAVYCLERANNVTLANIKMLEPDRSLRGISGNSDNLVSLDDLVALTVQAHSIIQL